MLSSRIALKEWSVVVEALGEGRQLILVRKGGIRDPKGAFQLEHREFLLYPTLEHQSEEAIRPEFRQQFKESLDSPKEPKAVALGFYGGVSYVGQIRDPKQMEGLKRHHIWTEEFFATRMSYRPAAPTFLVVLRVYRLPKQVLLPVEPEYIGCKSWVPLKQEIPVEGAQPVIDNKSFRAALVEISARLG